jgi:hypothetical protein
MGGLTERYRHCLAQSAIPGREISSGEKAFALGLKLRLASPQTLSSGVSGQSLSGKLIEFALSGILFDLAIPNLSIKLNKPSRESDEFGPVYQTQIQNVPFLSLEAASIDAL